MKVGIIGAGNVFAGVRDDVVVIDAGNHYPARVGENGVPQRHQPRGPRGLWRPL